jgi:outer membrane protein TolC
MGHTTGRFPWCVQLAGALLLGGGWTAEPLAAEAVRHVHEPPTATAPHQRSRPTPGELTLEQLEQLALERNPTLVQAAARIEAASQRKLQAGLYPNPVVGYDGQELSERASGGEHGGFVEQTLVTAGKLGLSRRVFEQEVGFYALYYLVLGYAGMRL